MAKKAKRNLTCAEKAAKAQRKAQFTTIFLDGRQKRVRRLDAMNGQDVREFLTPTTSCSGPESSNLTLAISGAKCSLSEPH